MPVLLHQQPVLTLALDSFQDTTIDENDIRRYKSYYIFIYIYLYFSYYYYYYYYYYYFCNILFWSTLKIFLKKKYLFIN